MRRRNKGNMELVLIDDFLPFFAVGHKVQLPGLKYRPEPPANKR